MADTRSYRSVGALIPETAAESRRLAGLLFVVLSAQFMTAVMLAAAMAPGYNFNEAAISDLGVIGETALLFNGSLVLVGLLNLVGGYSLYRVHGRRRVFAVYVAAAVGAVGAGVFTLDAEGLHGLFALLAFVGFNLQALVTATRLSGPIKALSVAAGLLGLAFLVVMAVGDSGNAAAFGAIGHGGTERMIVYPVMLWLVAFGGYLLAPGAGTGIRGAGDAGDRTA